MLAIVRKGKKAEINSKNLPPSVDRVSIYVLADECAVFFCLLALKALRILWTVGRQYGSVGANSGR